MLFKCTLKVRNALRLRDRDLDTVSGDLGLNVWFCNLFYIDRRKCLLWTHERSLFSVIAPGVRQADFRYFGELFCIHALPVLRGTEGVSASGKGRLLDCRPDSFAKTDSASVLGTMNDHILRCKDYVYDRGGLDQIDLDHLNHILNHIPLGALRFKFASERLLEVLET